MKFAIVGTGGRHQMYRTAITRTFAEDNELVALCDSNSGRLALSAAAVEGTRGNGIPTYPAAEFDQMLAEQRPDVVVVTTPDFTAQRLHRAALRARL